MQYAAVLATIFSLALISNRMSTVPPSNDSSVLLQSNANMGFDIYSSYAKGIGLSPPCNMIFDFVKMNSRAPGNLRQRNLNSSFHMGSIQSSKTI